MEVGSPWNNEPAEMVKDVDKYKRIFSSFIKISLAQSPGKGKQKCTIVRFSYNISNVIMFFEDRLR